MSGAPESRRSELLLLLLLLHLLLHHLLLPLLLLVLRGLEAMIRVASRRGTVLELHCRGAHRVLLALLLQLRLHLITWSVVPAGPVLVGAFAALRRRELVLQLPGSCGVGSSWRAAVGLIVGIVYGGGILTPEEGTEQECVPPQVFCNKAVAGI